MIEGFVYEGNTVHFDLYIERQDRTIESRTNTGLATVRCKSEIIVCFLFVFSNKKTILAFQFE